MLPYASCSCQEVIESNGLRKDEGSVGCLGEHYLEQTLNFLIGEVAIFCSHRDRPLHVGILRSLLGLSCLAKPVIFLHFSVTDNQCDQKKIAKCL